MRQTRGCTWVQNARTTLSNPFSPLLGPPVGDLPSFMLRHTSTPLLPHHRTKFLPTLPPTSLGEIPTWTCRSGQDRPESFDGLLSVSMGPFHVYSPPQTANCQSLTLMGYGLALQPTSHLDPLTYLPLLKHCQEPWAIARANAVAQVPNLAHTTPYHCQTSLKTMGTPTSRTPSTGSLAGPKEIATHC